MAVQLTIRNVPDELRDELASRAAVAGQSMQEYLLGELRRIADKPSPKRWVEEVRERKRIYGSEIGAAAILAERDAGRR